MTRQYEESEGEFDKTWTPSTYPCPFCKAINQNFYQKWESNDGAYTDWKHKCLACSKIWWIEGIDS